MAHQDQSRANHRSSETNLTTPPSPAHSTAPLNLLDLPADVLSQIAQYLPLPSQLHFLSLHRTLLSLCRSSLSPIPSTVRSILASPEPYPRLFARLPTLSLYLPDDPSLFVNVLVLARPRWIIETLEYGRWNESIWREAFERRFLRSWRRFKGEGDTWKAIFLRMLGRLEHRAVGCSHDENWTRFVTLHRNGSASLNRIYSRNFDPYDIFDEFKHQNNFAGQSTHVRVILHLQDVRILAIGVLLPQSSMFVNPNAHLVCHPPLLRNFNSAPSYDQSDQVVRREQMVRTQLASVSPSANSNEMYFPLVRSISPSGPATTTYGLGEGSSSRPATSYPSSPSSPSLLSSFARVLPGRTRRSSNAASEPEERGLFRPRSREPDGIDEGRRRAWSFGRARQGSSSNIATTSTAQMELSRTESRIAQPLTPAMPSLPEIVDKIVPPPTPPRTRTPSPLLQKRVQLPYPRLVKPQPHIAFKDYPNHTPGDVQPDTTGKLARADRRMQHDEVEDDGLAGVWSSPDSKWPEEVKMAEWDAVGQCRRRWVGPMILVAQIHPSTRESALPIGATGALEGDDPDLGHHGMYASLGYEDLEDLFPWVELKSAGTEGLSRRSGLGFE